MMPMPPSANQYWKTTVLPKKGLTWPITINTVRDIWQYVRAMPRMTTEAEEYQWCAKERFASLEQRPRMSSSPLCIEIVCCFATNARQDIDNRVKPLLDALTVCGIMEDDSQVVDLRIRRGPVIKEGRVVVRVWEIVPNYDRALYATGWGKIAPPPAPPASGTS
jgi:Holliday junction resolvase RusA-like endonuclease